MTRSLQPFFVAALLALALSLSACATSEERMRLDAQKMAVYDKHAGAPIDQIRSFRYISWQSVGDYSLLLEARLNDWYLIEVSGPCLGLPFARTIGFRNQMNTLQARFDSIIVEGEACRIETIRPIDAKAARQELRELQAG